MSPARDRKSAPRKRAAEAGARGPEGRQRGEPPEHPPGPGAVLLSWPIEVRWRDLDAFNHVNNASYLTYFEEARVRWMNSLPDPWLDGESAPVLAAVQINYRRPVEWPRSLRVELYVERLGRTSLTLGHRLVETAPDGTTTLYCDGHSVMVWIDRRSGKPCALPASLRASCTR